MILATFTAGDTAAVLLCLDGPRYELHLFDALDPTKNCVVDLEANENDAYYVFAALIVADETDIVVPALERLRKDVKACHFLP